VARITAQVSRSHAMLWRTDRSSFISILPSLARKIRTAAGIRDPLQVMRFVLKLHREMPIAAKAVCGVTGGNSRMLWRRSRD
jgi:hypothetical protein